MRIGLRATLVAVVLLAAARAHAGGFELDEQSPRGTATAGAQTAVAGDPSALYYNPAGLAYQHGLSAMVGAHFLFSDLNVRSSGVTTSTGGLRLAPVVYLAQRIDSHFAVGVGVFANFIEELDYPPSWPGAAGATQLSLSTTTINPSVAIRPIPQVAIGFGLDIVPAELTFARTGAARALVHSQMDAVGFGGNVSVLVTAVPRWLTLGASYRSAIDLDFSGVGNANGPDNPLDARATFPLPHNLSFGASTRPLERLTLSFDARVTLWHDLSQLSVAFVEPRADPATTLPVKDIVDLSLRDSFGFRLGGEYRPTDSLWLALGLGYDRTPVRRGWLVPLYPDNDRVLVGVGLGGHWKWIELGAAYSAQIVTSRTSTNPVPPMATYDGVRHVLTVALGAHFPQLLAKKIAPRYAD